MREEILEILSKDSRITPEQIGIMINKSTEEVCAEINKLEAEKIILKYNTVINWDKVKKHNMVSAAIEVNVQPQREVGFDQIAERIYRFPEVASVTLMSGNYDLSVKVNGTSLMEIASFVASKLSTIEGVQSTTSNFVLKNYKVEGVIFEDKEEDHRQAVTL